MGSRRSAIRFGVLIALAIVGSFYVFHRAQEERLIALELRYSDALSRARDVVSGFAWALPRTRPTTEDLDCGGLPHAPMFVAHVARVRWIAAGGRFGDETGIPSWVDSLPLRFLSGASTTSRDETELSDAIAGLEALASAESLAVLYTRHVEPVEARDGAMLEAVSGMMLFVRRGDGAVLCQVAVESPPTAGSAEESEAESVGDVLASASEASFWSEASASAARLMVRLRRE